MGFGFALVAEKGERHVGYTRVIVFFLDGEKLKMYLDIVDFRRRNRRAIG